MTSNSNSWVETLPYATDTSRIERWFPQYSLRRFGAKVLLFCAIATPFATIGSEHVVDHERKNVANSFAESAKPIINDQGAQLGVKLDQRFDRLAKTVDKISGEVDGAVADVNQFKQSFNEILTLLGFTTPQNLLPNADPLQQAAPGTTTPTTKP